MKRAMTVAALAAMLGGCSVQPAPVMATPQAGPDPVTRGKAIVAQWCSTCHTVDGVETSKTRGPTYEQIAQRPGRDAAYIRAFLDEDHFPMSTYRLLDAEKDDVTAMIISLKK
jgi:mono/diheme cytochrome c family protein